ARPLPRALRPGQRYLDRALAKSPGRRFQDAAVMRAALEQLPLSARARGAWPGAAVGRGRGALRRLPALAWVGIALLCAAALGLGPHLAEPVAPAVDDHAQPAMARAPSTGSPAPAPADP